MTSHLTTHSTPYEFPRRFLFGISFVRPCCWLPGRLCLALFPEGVTNSRHRLWTIKSHERSTDHCACRDVSGASRACFQHTKAPQRCVGYAGGEKKTATSRRDQADFHA